MSEAMFCGCPAANIPTLLELDGLEGPEAVQGYTCVCGKCFYTEPKQNDRAEPRVDLEFYLQSDGRFVRLADADDSAIPYSIARPEAQERWPRVAKP